MSDEKSPLARLVLFMVCLAITGSVLAGAHYGAVDLTAQKNLQAPQNAVNNQQNCNTCKQNCVADPDYWKCFSMCEDLICS